MLVACDESYTPSGPYLVFTSIWVPISVSLNLIRNVYEFRIEEKVWGEISWKKTTQNYLENYKKFIKIFISNSDVVFHTLLVPYKKSWFDIKKFFYGSDSAMRESHVGMLLAKRATTCKSNGIAEDFSFILDKDLITRTRFPNWPGLLRRKLDESGITPLIVTDCHSRTLPLIQAADLVAGATSTTWNKEVMNRQQQELIGCIENESKVKLENYDIYPPGFKDKKINNWLWRPM